MWKVGPRASSCLGILNNLPFSAFHSVASFNRLPVRYWTDTGVCVSVLFCFIDPRVRKIRIEASSCPGIFFRTHCVCNVASSPVSPSPIFMCVTGKSSFTNIIMIRFIGVIESSLHFFLADLVWETNPLWSIQWKLVQWLTTFIWLQWWVLLHIFVARESRDVWLAQADSTLIQAVPL